MSVHQSSVDKLKLNPFYIQLETCITKKEHEPSSKIQLHNPVQLSTWDNPVQLPSSNSAPQFNNPFLLNSPNVFYVSSTI